MGRDGFYIHAIGMSGSDGCLGPVHLADFQRLMASLADSKGGTLTVKGALGKGHLS